MSTKTWLFLAAAFAMVTQTVAAADGPFLADRHTKMGMKCDACHVSMGNPKLKIDDQKHEACVTCHGFYDAVSAKTNKPQFAVNPHSQHDGNLPCTECHKGHKAGVNYCAECHAYEFKVP